MIEKFLVKRMFKYGGANITIIGKMNPPLLLLAIVRQGIVLQIFKH